VPNGVSEKKIRDHKDKRNIPSEKPELAQGDPKQLERQLDQKSGSANKVRHLESRAPVDNSQLVMQIFALIETNNFTSPLFGRGARRRVQLCSPQ